MSLLDLAILLFLLAWAGGLSIHIADDRIHLLLLIASVMLIARLASSRRA
jgi:hypothetical protein